MRASWWRSLATSVLVVALEASALVWLLLSSGAAATDVTAALRVGAGVQAQATAPRGPGDSLRPEVQTATVAWLADGLRSLADRGIPADLLAQPRTAAEGLAHATTAASGPAIATVAAAFEKLEDQLRHRAAGAERRGVIGIVVVLLLACVSWGAVFARLMKDRRAAERVAGEQQALRDSEQRFRSLVQRSTDVIAVVDADSTIGQVTPAVQTVLGLPPELAVGRRWVELVHADDVPAFVAMLGRACVGTEEQLRVRLRHVDGRLVVADLVVVNLLAEETVQGLLVTARDVTDRAELEERLSVQALHDPLTGLANRVLFADRLAHALERRDGTASVAVVFGDLDDFKNVNDGLGHAAGDEVLREVTRRLLVVSRTGDTVARLGGDEFALLLEDVTRAEACEVAERVRDALAVPIQLGDTEVVTGTSLGIALAARSAGGSVSGAGGAVTAEDLLRNADMAMYSAKGRGKGRVEVYESAMHDDAMRRLELRGELQRALRHNEFRLHYQPIVDLASGAIRGVEALLRWEHPERGMVSPLDFVPVAEESGLIIPIGRWVLEEACRTAASFASAGRPLRMSVNVAARQLEHAGLLDDVIGALRVSGLDPRLLVVEVTESAVLHDLDAIRPKLLALQGVGVKVAIDDFGTGYSSLAYLHSLPVNVLKIDKSFVDRVERGGQDAAVAEAVVTMSHSMQLETVAEGIERTGQADTLLAMRCDLGQGFLWSRPVTAEALRELVSRSAVPAPRAAGEEAVSPAVA
ncbi:MAG: putative bifunctional diguanylate cyclase/phosphodiesterase [Actinomycetales bacterium]